VAVGLFLPRTKAKHTILAGFALVVIGTGFLFLTTEAGDAAADQVHKSPAVSSPLHEHEELAETTEIAFGTLFALFAALMFGPTLLKKELTIQSSVLGFQSSYSPISALPC
jgi:hypothetical protein